MKTKAGYCIGGGPNHRMYMAHYSSEVPFFKPSGAIVHHSTEPQEPVEITEVGRYVWDDFDRVWVWRTA